VNEFCFESINWSPYFGCRGQSPATLVEAAASAGFDWISFDASLLEVATQDDGSLLGLATAIERADLGALAVHSVAISDDADADQRLAAPLIAAAEALGAPYLHCGVRSEPGDGVFESTRRLSAFARESGVSLAIEFLPFLPVASISDARRIVEACEDTRAGMVIDSWHFFFGPDGWPELESLAASEIAYVQFDDHPALQSEDLLNETTERRVLPGSGEFDLTRFSRTLLDAGYDGAVGLEHLSHQSRQRPPRDVATELIQASRRYWEATPRPADRR